MICLRPVALLGLAATGRDRQMLTPKQFELLRFIHERLTESGVPPSFDEMKDALDLRSKSGIHRLGKALAGRGFVKRLPPPVRGPGRGRIAAGTPIEAIQTHSHTIGVPPDMLTPGEHFALEVRGDSMIDAGIYDGDT